jgi:hypothetical protein
MIYVLLVTLEVCVNNVIYLIIDKMELILNLHNLNAGVVIKSSIIF